MTNRDAFREVVETDRAFRAQLSDARASGLITDREYVAWMAELDRDREEYMTTIREAAR